MLPKERQKEIALEIIGKMNDRGNYADPRIRFVNSETCIVEGYFGLDDRGNVVYTMVKIINQDKTFFFCGFSKKHPTDPYNPELGFSLAVQRALWSVAKDYDSV
jgi:hypothetical protein